MTSKPYKLDWEMIDRLFVSGCNANQVASALGISDRALINGILRDKGVTTKEYKASKRAKGDSFIHSKQFEVALKGSIPMLIWLGKQRLAQRDDPRGGIEFNGKLAEFLDHIKSIGKGKEGKKAEKDKEKE